MKDFNITFWHSRLRPRFVTAAGPAMPAACREPCIEAQRLLQSPLLLPQLELHFTNTTCSLRPAGQPLHGGDLSMPASISPFSTFKLTCRSSILQPVGLA